jgi:energy-coupling factor transporter ATP-binding protein EcfA2
MISHLLARNFKAVPHLETSQLMQTYPEGVYFSKDKPNVIVGPNGTGKSALLQALSMKTLTHFYPSSSFDDNYVRGNDCEDFWEQTGWSFERQYTFLPGLACESDFAPALYYRPQHIPGNCDFAAEAFASGYYEEAREYDELTDDKSSGQQSQALLSRIETALSGDLTELKYRYMHWTYDSEPRNPEGRNWGSDNSKAENLKRQYGQADSKALPVIMMDEPEQSLDARAEALLWKQIAGADAGRMQIIVATHSLYPLLHPEKFNLIETVPGYAEDVRAML